MHLYKFYLYPNMMQSVAQTVAYLSTQSLHLLMLYLRLCLLLLEASGSLIVVRQVALGLCHLKLTHIFALYQLCYLSLLMRKGQLQLHHYLGCIKYHYLNRLLLLRRLCLQYTTQEWGLYHHILKNSPDYLPRLLQLRRYYYLMSQIGRGFL